MRPCPNCKSTDRVRATQSRSLDFEKALAEIVDRERRGTETIECRQCGKRTEERL